MASFWRRLGAIDQPRISALVLVLMLAGALAAYALTTYAFAAARFVRPSPGALAAALALLGLGGSGLLYAWRSGAGGLAD